MKNENTPAGSNTIDPQSYRALKSKIEGDENPVGVAELAGINAGLTKREYAAVAAMQGLLSRGESGKFEDFAKLAVKQADALFKELDKTHEVLK